MKMRKPKTPAEIKYVAAMTKAKAYYDEETVKIKARFALSSLQALIEFATAQGAIEKKKGRKV